MADLRDYTKKNPIFVGTDGMRLPSGNSAQRVASANVAGTMRYNTDIGGMEMYTPNGWLPLAAPPTVSTVSPSTYSGVSGTEFTINGSGFTPDAQVYFVIANGTAILASTVSYYSAVQIRATTPRVIKVEEEPISVRVTQQSGTVTKTDCIDAGGVPNWITTAGTLGSIFGANTVNVYVSATDPEGSAITYQITSGSLPGGLNFSTANGLVQGVANSVLANTTYNFTIKANDTVNNNTDRSFSYTVLNRAPVINTAAGSLGTIVSGNVASASISAYDPDGGSITYSVSSGTLPINSSLGSANGVISGTPVVVTTNTTYSFTITSTDEGNLTASNNYTFTVLNRPPLWNTAATLSDITEDNASVYIANTTINAYDPDGGSITYTLASGSLPTGMTLVSSNGALAGPITPVDSNTTSTFTVTATDPGEMGNTRTFSLTIQGPLPDANFANTSILLRADADTVIKDTSTNNLPITVVGDSRASNFNPYNTSWSGYFNGSSSIRTVANSNLAIGTGDVTVEFWMNTFDNSDNGIFGTTDEAAWNSTSWSFIYSSGAISLYNGNGGGVFWSISTGTLHDGNWHHVAIVRSSGTWQVFVNGVSKGTTTTQGSRSLGNNTWRFAVGCIEPSNADLKFTGYISNFRLNNTALYSSNFTPSTTPLTAITGTTLLTCQSNRFVDNKTSPTSFTAGSFPQIVGLSPFAETDTSNGSMYFDGDGDYLTISNNTAFSYSSTFSAELWYYSTHTSCTDVIPFSGNGNWDFIIPAATTVAFRWFVPGYGDTGAHTMIPSSWNHIAVSVSGGRLSFYLNGTRMYTNDAVSFSLGGSDPSRIGYGSNSIMKGYISNVRVTRGSTPYDPTQTTITVPTSPLTTVSGTTFLTLQKRKGHNNHAFIDESRNKSLITRFGNTSQGTFTPFSADAGKWSTFFTKSNTTYLELPNGSVNVGANDFSIECWLYPLDRNGASTMFGGNTNRATAGGSSITFTLTNSNGYIECTAWIGGGAVNLYSPAIPLNTWTHAVFCRTGSSMSLFVNGTRVATSTSAGGSAVNDGASTYNPAIGANGAGSADNFNGYISNFRMIIGSGVYNATSSSITVPTSPLTAVTNTRVLACQDNRFIDRSTNAYTITPSGLPSIQLFSPFTPNTAYSVANTGGSIYNQAAGDGLKFLTSNHSFGINGDFTIEMWYYPTGQTGDYNLLWALTDSTSDDNPSIGFFFNSSYNLFWLNNGAGGNGFDTGAGINIVPFQWTHIVISRSGANTRCWTNGKLRISNWGVGAINTSKRFLYVGIDRTATVTTPGYTSGFRFVNGTALYSGASDFTPPSAPPTAVANTVALVHGTNAGIYDATGKHVIQTVADARVNTAQSKFSGSGAMYFDGTGDYLTIKENPIYRFGASDFTIEGWIYPTAIGGSGYYTLGWHNNGSSVSDFSGTTQINPNVWTHIAWSKSGTSMRFFINGTLDAGGVKSVPEIIYNNTDPLRIGYGVDHSAGSGRDFCHCGEAGGGNNKWFAYFANGGTGNYIGYIADFRITRVARYTTNFTAPTKSFAGR